MPLFFTYILTDWNKQVLYTGVTNALTDRLVEHYVAKTDKFTGRYFAQYLVWYESSKYVINAIEREKEIKSWLRAKKIAMIDEFNPGWRFMNEDFIGTWPPTEVQIADVLLRRQNHSEK